jgi:hypothetical protein
MSDSQYTVFHFDVQTMSARDAQGREPSQGSDAPLLFDDLTVAERYCEEKIAANPTLGCRILDHTGKVVRTFANDQVYEKHHGRPAAKRSILIGAACLVAGAGGVALDAWLGWRLVFGVLLGVRFLWVGTVKTAEGIASLMQERAARRGAQ